ncbi:MAG: OsmC family protein [Nitrospirota bacterium]
MTVAEQTLINGVNVRDIENMVNAIKNDPGIAQFKFRLTNTWIDGGFNKASVGRFYGVNQEHSHLKTFTWEADEPPALAGKDRGANPVEHLLASLAACLTTTLVYHAAIRGITIDELECSLEGDIDLRGFLGLSNEVRRGYQNIRVNFKVKTDEGNIEKLKALSKLSPVFDVTANGTKVDVQIERK